MLKIHNFGAGPCILAPAVIEGAANAVLDWNNSGLSILEVSHRSKEFESVIKKTQILVRELLNVPENYSILFLQGGASTQFSMLAMNFLQGKQRASYLDTGYFATKALKEARLFGTVEVVASSREAGYRYIPENYDISYDSSYLHLTSNNTIEGTQLFDFPNTSLPVICDMSSDIFSREINVKDFSLIYAGAQKNMGPAGMTLVIAKNSFLDTVEHMVPSMLDYRLFRDNNSMLNTPPVFAIYVAMLNMIWLKEQGGVKEMELRSHRKAKLLYNEIDRNTLFTGLANVAHRSNMNVTFAARNLNIENSFLKLAEKRGLVGIKGYRTVGGFRVSLYNALPVESVKVLIDLMCEFEQSVLKEESAYGLECV